MIESFVHSDYQIPEITRKLTLGRLSSAITGRCRVGHAFRPAVGASRPPSSSMADLRLGAAAEQHAVRQNDRHHTVLLEVVKPVQQEREVRRRLRGSP